MDIAAAATVMSRTALSQAVGIRVLNMAKNQAEVQGQNLIQMLEQSTGNPNLGKNVDIRV
ncbi:putative motility protein YjfB-like [Fontibacillus phaseoli]|uniref:Putative motility protein YjfB-like n=1 Tax=Fontibacillus phaseoli TaxID=1416533 RepID=A0A369B9Z3_9BACL|nr:YjfB family protein [Fontibacillus phaseoli]RCX18221.1 putative motility protein YjfB-like [Fontibacillus phaseoli]